MLSISFIATTDTSASLTASLCFPLAGLYKESLPYLADCETFPALITRLSYHVAVHTPVDPILGAYDYFYPRWVLVFIHLGRIRHPHLSIQVLYRTGDVTTLQLSLYATT